ncbi:copper homeostasis membrane protein CopD [Rhizobium tubonense]|uniref:copper homeostasis membrane protein CopD n=1 Tax=Rhizobium tubonense TaxID=484088 RepID=UPI001FCEBA65|nr:copper homeostasis membrane protein CopD [Rhizobium tubonense]
MIDLQTALEACRFLHNASLMFLWGTSAFLCILVPRPLATTIWHALGRALAVAAAVAIATTILSLPLEAGSIGDGWNGAIDPATVHDVLFETTVGQAWQVQVVAAALLAMAFLAPKKMRMALVAFASGFSLASLALTGHASMHQGWLELVHRSNDVIHVLSSGAWVGALVPLASALGLLADDRFRADAQLALRRFSNVGHGAVALVIVSGIFNTLLVLQRLPTDWSSPYQMLLAAKILLVFSMIGLAIANRYIFVPWMAKSPTQTIEAVRLGCVAEIVLGLIVLALVAIFGILEPV